MAQARIRISSVDTPALTDTSDAGFTISETLQTITVSAPAQNEVWAVEQERIIVWSNQDVTGNVKIQLSRDGG